MDTRIFYKECQSLAKEYRVILVARHPVAEKVDGVEIIPFPAFNGRISRILVAPFKMFALVRKLDGEIYHIHDPELLITALLLKIFCRTKVIYDVHEDYVGFISYKQYIPAAFRRLLALFFSALEQTIPRHLDYLIAATPFIGEKMKKINPRSAVVNNFPILENTAVIGNDITKERAVCYVGSITRERGIVNVIKALEGVDVTLLLAGDYEPKSLRNELINMPAWSKVRENGFVSRGKAREIMSASLAGIVTFLAEPNHIHAQPNKIFEYMHAGIPVIASDFPLWKSLVSEAGCGILVQPDDSNTITKAIQFILDHPDQAKEFGANGQRAVREKFNWAQEETKLQEVYSQLLQ
jgi:glycosyltransferase involved in cell wall biosynthesis